MQPHAGNPEGFHLPLRKGTEVMVAFLAGNADRPVIAGGVPNAETPSPVTSKNNTKNILHTGSDNHIEVEDEDDKQWIDWKTPPKDTYLHLGEPHAPHTHYIEAHTGGDCLFEIGSNQDINVGGKLTETVKGAVDEKYKTSQTSDVKGPQTTTVKGAVESYTGGHKTTTTGLVAELYEAAQKSTVTGGARNERYETGQTSMRHRGRDPELPGGAGSHAVGRLHADVQGHVPLLRFRRGEAHVRRRGDPGLGRDNLPPRERHLRSIPGRQTCSPRSGSSRCRRRPSSAPSSRS